MAILWKYILYKSVILIFRIHLSTFIKKMLIQLRESKDLSRVKAVFKSVPPQFYFEIAGLASAEKWREIQNMHEEERL